MESQQPISLSIGWIQAAIEKKEYGPKPYLLQIFDLDASLAMGPDWLDCAISDSKESVNGLCFAKGQTFHDLDIVKVESYNILMQNGEPIIALDGLTLVQGNMREIIGDPRFTTYTQKSLPSKKPVEESKMKFKSLKQLKEGDTDWYTRVQVIAKNPTKRFLNDDDSLTIKVAIKVIDEDKTIMFAVLFETPTNRTNIRVGSYYTIANAVVKVPKSIIYHSFDVKYCLILDKNSEITERKPCFKFKWTEPKYVSIADVYEKSIGTLIDVLGIVKVPGSVRVSQTRGEELTRRKITVFDESEREIDLMLWDHFAKKDIELNQIIGASNVAIVVYQGVRELKTTSGTILELNPETSRIDALREARSGFKPKNIQEECERISGRQLLLAEIQRTREDTDLPENEKEGEFTTRAMIADYYYSPGHIYFGCPSCKRRKSLNTCTSCRADGIVTYYNFLLKLSDSARSMWVRVLWNAGDKILGMTAEESVKTKSAPAALLALKGTVHTFVVEIRDNSMGVIPDAPNMANLLKDMSPINLISSNKVLIGRLEIYKRKLP